MPLPTKAKTEDPSVRIRFPSAVLREVDKAAAKAGRSRNSEIIYRLAQSLNGHQPVRPIAALAD